MSKAVRPHILWFRLDLRLADNPALDAARVAGNPIVPVFVWSPEEEMPWPPGAASRWWLHHSLERLDTDLRARGSRLVIRRGPALPTLQALVHETGAQGAYWNRRYEPMAIARDTAIKEALKAEGLTVETYNSALLHEPWTIRNQSGKPFQVFTPYWKSCLAHPDPSEPTPAPPTLAGPTVWPKSLNLGDLDLLPSIPWDVGLRAAWQSGEAGGAESLARFVAAPVFEYGEERNRPDRTGTSRLSPHLHFGELGPRQVWHAVRQAATRSGVPVATWRSGQFLAEIGWREFAHHLLFHFPETPMHPLRGEFAQFPWRSDPESLEAWRRGRTGIPLVDAGMRELWATGWMHNRVRMVVGSFLVKNLLLSWREGAAWFWDTLVDADLASNTLGWQWVAGCGADAAPYFRVFNPVTQGQKFDPDGHYVRRWVPELARLPAGHIHAPDKAPPDVLRAAGVTMGIHYPHPVVSLSASRMAALAAFSRIKERKEAG